MPNVNIGDEVRVFDQNGPRMGQPKGGWAGKVAKVGRSLVTIEYGGRTETFRMETRVRNDDYGHRWFKTLEQVAQDERESRAMAVLKDRKIKLDFGHGLTIDQIEALADVARKFR